MDRLTYCLERLEKARDFSKLHPKVIIDKNGRKMTVYVGDEGAANNEGRTNKGRTAILRDKLKQNLRPYFDSLIKNRHSSVRAYLSGNCVSKIASDKAIKKSKDNGFTVDQHFEIANRIVPLFRNSYLIKTEKDKDNNPHIKSVKRFAIPAKLSDGTETRVWITVLEATVQGHRIYSVELMEIKKAPHKKGASSGTVGKSNVTTESRNPSKNRKSDFEPVTSTHTLPHSSDTVKKKDIKKSAKNKKWLWIDSNGKIWIRKNVVEAWKRGLAGEKSNRENKSPLQKSIDALLESLGEQ